MISLASELTDGKGRHARGWLFFDAECTFCTSAARRLLRPMKRRRLELAPLQDPRVGALLGLSEKQLLREIRFVSPDGSQSLGAYAVLAVAQEFWWMLPLTWIARVSGMMPLVEAGYRWVARRRSCRAERDATVPLTSGPG